MSEVEMTVLTTIHIIADQPVIVKCELDFCQIDKRFIFEEIPTDVSFQIVHCYKLNETITIDFWKKLVNARMKPSIYFHKSKESFSWIHGRLDCIMINPNDPDYVQLYISCDSEFIYNDDEKLTEDDMRNIQPEEPPKEGCIEDNIYIQHDDIPLSVLD